MTAVRTIGASAPAFFVIPLSMQRDGENFMIGNAELEEFYQFPAQGVRIIDLLRAGETPERIKRQLHDETGEDVDVDDFIESLVEIGFIYPFDERGRFAERMAARPRDRRLSFAIDPALARTLLSPATLVLYAALVGAAGYGMITRPELRLDPRALALEHDITLTMIPLLLLYMGTVTLHESAHILAAARHGVRSKLGIGNRLWSLVAEADLSGILVLPKRQRYLPLLAGMMMDVLTVSLATLAIAALLARGMDGYPVQLLRALELQVVITLTWQFNIFLRTDVYYALCTYLNHPDLDADARRYLAAIAYRSSGGRFGRPAAAVDHHRMALLRGFAAIWLVGRLMALALLVFVLIPTLLHYILQAWRTFRDPATPTAVLLDQLGFLSISLTLFGSGMFLWLRRRLFRPRAVEART
jgi:putative peptide zinc metalloprotease protein